MTQILTIQQTLVDLPPAKGRKTPRRVFVEERFREQLADGEGTVVLAGRIGADELIVLRHEDDLYAETSFEDIDGVPTLRSRITNTVQALPNQGAEVPHMDVGSLAPDELQAYDLVRKPYRPLAGTHMVLDGRVVVRRSADDFMVLVDVKGNKPTDTTVDLIHAAASNMGLYEASSAAPMSILADLAPLDPNTRLDVFEAGAFASAGSTDADRYRVFNGGTGAAYLDRLRDKLSIVSSSFLRTFADGIDAAAVGDHVTVWQKLEALTRMNEEGTKYAVPTLGLVKAARIVAEYEDLMETLGNDPDPVAEPQRPAPRTASPRP